MKKGSALAVHVCLIYICLLSTGIAASGLNSAATDSDGESIEKNDKLESEVNAVIGGGISFRLDDWIDFKFTDDALLIENDSQRRPILLAGTLFYVKPFLDKYTCLKPLGWFTDDVLLSVAFTDDTSQTGIDEFLVGLSKRITGNLNFVVGYSLVKGKELSPGFQESASQFIKKMNNDHSEYERFIEFKSNEGTETQKLLDGLPLADPNKKKFFLGDPVISSTNHGLYFGFVTSIGLKEMITLGGGD